jgi:RNA polymerase sigma factor (sigma-70 family)
MDEPALIHDAQRGDLEAFNRLVLAYQDALYNTALRILGDEALAADATQEAFISAFRSLTSYRGGSFKAWLLRTVTNACYDELRRQKRRPSVPLEPSNDDDEEIESPRCPPISAPSLSWPTSRAWTMPKSPSLRASHSARSKADWPAPVCACANVCKALGNFCPPPSVWKGRDHYDSAQFPRR